jgi:gamma-glutamyl hydrolase
MIGIITAPNIKSEVHCGESYLHMSYIHWVEMSGETAVIIPYDISEEKLVEMLKRVNGVIWVGGGIENRKQHTEKQNDDLMNTLFTTYQYVVAENDKGNYYPLWGTCLGFYILLMFVKEESQTIRGSIVPYEKSGVFPCTFTQTPSKLKKWMAPLQSRMRSQSCITQNHKYGIDNVPEDKVRIVSMQDNFVNMVEFIHYPFYGVHFHPERPQNELAIKVSQQLGTFFKNECSKNKNKWKWEISDFTKRKIVL